MKYLITGVKGQLGYDIVRELQKRKLINYGYQLSEYAWLHTPKSRL